MERDSLHHSFYLQVQTAEPGFSTSGTILPNCRHLLKAFDVYILLIYHSEQRLVILGYKIMNIAQCFLDLTLKNLVSCLGRLNTALL